MIVGRVGIAPFQIVPNGALKQDALLRHQTNALVKRFHPVFLYVHPIQQHLSLFRIIKPGNQMNQRGFPGACAADDSNCLPRRRLEADMLQSGFTGALIPNGYIPEFNRAAQFIRRTDSVLLGRFDFQDSIHTGGTGGRLGHVDNQVGHFDQLNQNLRHIVVQRNHKTLRQNPVVHLHSADFYQQHHSQIDNHEGHGVHQIGNSTSALLLRLKLRRLVFKRALLAGLHGKCPQNPHAGQVLPGRGGDPVQTALKPFVHGHGDCHNAEHNQTQDRDDPGKYHRRLSVDGKRHNHGAEHHKRRPQQQPQRQIHTVLYLIDVRGHPGHHGGGAQRVDFRVTKAQNVRHYRMAQPRGESHSSLGCEILRRNRAGQSHNAQQDHDQTHFYHIAAISAADALVHNVCHDQRNHQFEAGLQQFEQRAQHTFSAIALHVLQKVFHFSPPLSFFWHYITCQIKFQSHDSCRRRKQSMFLS